MDNQITIFHDVFGLAFGTQFRLRHKILLNRLYIMQAEGRIREEQANIKQLQDETLKLEERYDLGD